MSLHRASRWYDRFSKIYDNTNDYPYKSIRMKAIQTLNVEPEDTILDLFCGTGVNFAQIVSRLRGKGTLIGIDGSSGMLQRARSRIQKNDWDEARILLLQEDLREMNSTAYKKLLPKEGPVKVLITLGAAGLPGWESFWDNLYTALPAGARIVTMDVHCPKGTLSGAVINFFGAGDFREDVSSYKPWNRLKARCVDFRKEVYYPFRILKCTVVLASGTPIVATR